VLNVKFFTVFILAISSVTLVPSSAGAGASAAILLPVVVKVASSATPTPGFVGPGLSDIPLFLVDPGPAVGRLTFSGWLDDGSFLSMYTCISFPHNVDTTGGQQLQSAFLCISYKKEVFYYKKMFLMVLFFRSSHRFNGHLKNKY
jgi:hypothetical protein